MLAFTSTDFGDMRAAYVFMYPRGSGRHFSLRPDSFGLNGSVYVYNDFTGSGQLTNAANLFSDEIEGSYAYYVVTSVRPSGVGLLADAGQWVQLGRQRITSVTDTGDLRLTVTFAGRREPSHPRSFG